MTNPRILITIVLTMAAAPLQAFAQADSSTTMTRDELRACMAQEASLRTRSDAHQAEAARSNEEAASIAAESGNLIRLSVNGFKDKAARDAHALRSNVLNKRVDAFNAKSKQIRLALADIQTMQAEYLRKCGGKSFYVEDKNAILSERDSGKHSAKPLDQAASARQQN